ncbi:nuclear transport factor 2 family protein [Streptomyces hokutonensis]|uniref:nuclear transport factor 2 family protein n=1 Tax=Streptomyces hokutonensis TaxID=1306990 RepID=UPI0036C82C41
MSTCGKLDTTERHRDLFPGVYTWVSDLCDVENGSAIDDIHHYWADDGGIVSFGRAKAAGVEALRKHFEVFPELYEKVEVREPFHTYLEAGDRGAIEHDILIRTGDRDRAVIAREAGREEFRVTSIFTVLDGRITEMREAAAVKAGDD